MGGTTSGIRVLHVDDDPQRRRVTQRVLESVGDDIEVVTEPTAEKGLQRLAEGSIDCVVSDYEMPRMDGLEFLDAVRDEYPDLPFVLFTGRGNEEIASEAISMGVTEYLQKSGGTDNYRILANRIENAVAKREAQLEADRVYRAMETAEEGISLLDEDGRFTYVNRAYADLYGYDPEEMVGEHWELIYPDAEIDEVYDDILPAVGESETWQGRTVGLRSDGTTFVEDHTLAELEDGGLICTVQDVSRQPGASDRASLTTEVLDTSDVATLVIDEDCNVVWVNEAAEEYFGLDRKTVIGADKSELVREEIEQRFVNSDRFAERVLATYDDNSYVENFECHLRGTDDTEERWLEHWSQPIETGPYAGGRIEHYTDITEQKRRQRELERRRRKLQDKTERLENFASVLSHDLRNPVSIARTYAGMLRENGDADPEVVAELDCALDRADTIIQDVLTLARDDVAAEDCTPVDLSAVARAAWENVSPSDAALEVDGECVVRADETQLQRLLRNLFENAVEHRPESDSDGRADAVTVRIGPLEEGSGFYVADDGPGIPEDERDRVFEWSYSTSPQGTGFGLAIVRQIARAHGWEIALTDSDDGGARFELRDVEITECAEPQ